MQTWKPLEAGDKVALLSSASFPEESRFQECMTTIPEWGRQPVPGPHVLDRYGFMDGKDVRRLHDLNAAIDADTHQLTQKASFPANAGRYSEEDIDVT